MDPDNTLQAIRDIVEEALASDGECDKILELAERFEALDEWLARGGFLPAGWQPKLDGKEVQATDDTATCNHCGKALWTFQGKCLQCVEEVCRECFGYGRGCPCAEGDDAR